MPCRQEARASNPRTHPQTYRHKGLPVWHSSGCTAMRSHMGSTQRRDVMQCAHRMITASAPCASPVKHLQS